MRQECLSCGRNTAAGTSLFGARKRGLDCKSGDDGFLCQACQEGSAVVVPSQTIPLSGRYVVVDIPGGMSGY